MRLQDSAASERRTRPDAARPLRILCLHGYRGNADVLRSQMRSLASGLEPLVELVYVDAPSLSAGDYGWWHAVRDAHDDDRGDPGVEHRRMRYRGWERSRDALIALFAKEGPFDGVLGFSQGAALTALLVGLRAPDGIPTAARPLAFDFAMMVGGFVSNDPDHASLYASRASYALPSLHILGLSDGIVPASDSRALAARFENPVVLEHPGGHVIASDPSIRNQVKRFLAEMARRRTARQSMEQGRNSQGTTPAALRVLDVPLWPGKSLPAMRVVFPSSPRSSPTPAIVVFRGGGYVTNAGSGGGSAEWAASHGMVGVEVAYRTQGTGDAYPAPYDDAARAVRLVRERASEWGIDRNRVAVMGYSAGGHLASLLSTRPSLRIAPEDDLAPRISARPDLLVLAYPVISFVDHYAPGAFAGTAESFLGRADLSEATRRQFSNELHVDHTHPPVFLWTTEDDSIVPYTHSVLFAEACARSNVPVAFTLFPHGPHGMGLASGITTDVATWTDRLLAWLDVQWPRSPQ